MQPSVPAPVPESVYTEDYFLHARHGADEFVRSGGREISPIHAKILDLAEAREGRRILDVGCGCGELVIHAALRGAEAVGVDYAEAAHRIALETAARLGVGTDRKIPGRGAARFIKGDVSELPEETFDAIILADIVEHLHQHQLDRLYRDLRKRLTPGGRIVIHTWPNRWHTEYSYPIARLLLKLVGIEKPKSPRKPHDEIMHVNEQSILSLRRDLRRAGFAPRIWIEHLNPPDAGFLYRAAHGWPGLRLFFADHLFAVATP
jgi:2-polyprenyl-3-methyl-5-hydroxy-6-metoxy-1,4-benzoquinol methylase